LLALRRVAPSYPADAAAPYDPDESFPEFEKAGFSFRGKQHLYAENTGWADFLYYEKTLDPA
ncbi:MAG: hypothetical protein IKX21_07500, partial [Deltaproteobacteria bacterium]|nr:hypothetical protein [Deltaproteobacteria bacterium]